MLDFYKNGKKSKMSFYFIKLKKTVKFLGTKQIHFDIYKNNLLKLC